MIDGLEAHSHARRDIEENSLHLENTIFLSSVKSTGCPVTVERLLHSQFVPEFPETSALGVAYVINWHNRSQQDAKQIHTFVSSYFTVLPRYRI
jgi:hypothetical protein